MYFHTGLTGWFDYGPLKTLRSCLLGVQGQGGEKYLEQFYAIHMGYLVKSFNGTIFDCKGGNRKLPVSYSNSIIEFLNREEIKKDP